MGRNSFIFLELIASTISRLLAQRWPAEPLGYSVTDHQYDHDYNRLDNGNGPFETPVYSAAADALPAIQFEKIFYLLCSVPHQGLILYHQAIQGTILLLLTVIRIIINMIRQLSI